MKTILIIEDDREILELLSDILEMEDYEVLTAVNGKLGVSKAYEKFPDLIICDIMMPEMDGYEVLRHIRSNPQTFGTPFLFLTAKADKSDLRHGMELGADDYITKPFENKEILSAIRTRFEKYEQMKKHYEKNLEELRLNVSTSIPHELRTPLNSILGFTQILRSSHKDLSGSDIEMMYDNIMDAGKRLLRLIVNYSYYTNLLNINAANSNKEESVEHPAGMIRDQAMQIADKYSRINDLEFYLDDIPVRISENMLLKTAEELTDNACKFSYSDTPIRINGHRTDNSYRLSFSNLGRGMKPDQVDNIGAFMQFDRRKFEQQGSGLGLAIVKKIAEISGGDFDIDSTPGKGTSISIELPIAE